MNRKTLRILLAVFIIFAILASFDWWSKYLPLNKLTPKNTEVDFTQYSQNSIDSFSFKKGSDEKKFTKAPSGWLVNDRPATPSAINDFFADLGSANVGSLVSKNPENQSSFGLTDTDDYILTFTKGGNATTFIVGNITPDYSSFYVKKKDSPLVFQVSGTLRDKLTLDLAFWQASSSATISSQMK